MIGKFAVFEGNMIDGYVCAKVIDETAAFWEVENQRSLDRRRIKKTRMLRDLVAVMDNYDDGVNLASSVTDKIKGAKRHFEQQRLQIISSAKEANK